MSSTSVQIAIIKSENVNLFDNDDDNERIFKLNLNQTIKQIKSINANAHTHFSKIKCKYYIVTY